MSFGPSVPSAGPLTSRIFILGHHPHEGKHFEGEYELRRMLATIGLNLNDCYRANVFSRQPAGNNLALYSIPKDHPMADTSRSPLCTNPLGYFNREHDTELLRLASELDTVKPNIILALGNTACWALGLGTGINGLRGAVHTTQVNGRTVKVLPTYHPASILRQWDQRVVALADLAKAERESHYPELRFDNTELWLNPTLEDLEEFDQLHMTPATRCACDIETKRGQMDFICFTPSPADVSLSIPFWINGPSPNYWPTVEEELIAWGYVRKWMERPDLIKVFQNGVFDLSFIPTVGIIPRGCSEDTMLQAHSLYSELQKGLGFLGTIHANVPSWKSMIHHRSDELTKAGD